jgi:hypothetical protein
MGVSNIKYIFNFFRFLLILLAERTLIELQVLELILVLHDEYVDYLPVGRVCHNSCSHGRESQGLYSCST